MFMTLNFFRLCYLTQTLILELKKLLDDHFQDKIDAMYQEYRIVSMEISVSFRDGYSISLVIISLFSFI